MDPAVLVAGEALVDFLPATERPLADVERFERAPGGAPANVAVRLAQLEEPPWFWTRVGSDPFGDFLAGMLASRGVPDRFVERDPDAKTSLAFASRDPTADRRFTFYRDGTADTRLSPGGVPDAVLEDVSWVVLGSVALSQSPSREAVLDLAARAAAADAAVVFDVNARPELWGERDFAATVREVLPAVDVVTASESELAAVGVSGPDHAARAGALFEDGPHTVFETRGASGASVAASAGAPWGPAERSHPGYDVDAVDATGAGDAFTAGVVAAFADGARDVAAVLSRANAVAAAATTRVGGITAP
jgi:fructokinase